MILHGQHLVLRDEVPDAAARHLDAVEVDRRLRERRRHVRRGRDEQRRRACVRRWSLYNASNAVTQLTPPHPPGGVTAGRSPTVSVTPCVVRVAVALAPSVVGDRALLPGGAVDRRGRDLHRDAVVRGTRAADVAAGRGDADVVVAARQRHARRPGDGRRTALRKGRHDVGARDRHRRAAVDRDRERGERANRPAGRSRRRAPTGP